MDRRKTTYHNSRSQYSSVNENIRFETSMLGSDLCHFSNSYIIVKGKITIEGDNDAKIRNKKLIKNKAT